MFDWVPKKNQQQPASEKKTSVDMDELFAIDSISRNPVKNISEQKSEPVKQEPKPTQKPKAPAIPTQAKKPKTEEEKQEKNDVFLQSSQTPTSYIDDEKIFTSDNFSIEENPETEEISIIEPTLIQSDKISETKDVKSFFIDDEKISPLGAASIHQDEIRKQNKPKEEKWDIPNILDFIDNIDTQAVFSSPVKNVSQPTENNHIPSVQTNKKDDIDSEDELIKNLIKGRFPFHSGKDNFDNELKASSSPYINAFTDTIDAPPTMIVDDFGDRSLWELQLNNSNLPGMELEEFNLINFDHIYINEMRRGFKRARRDFIKFISYNNQQDLFSAGLKDTDIALLHKGYVCENFNIHRKIPYEYGGNNDFSNFCFIQTHPYHDNLHKFLDMQVFIHPKGTKVKRLFIPIPTGSVYLPYLDINGSGGKSKHDRSVYAGFHKETFDLINLKTSMGKAAEL